MIGVGFAVDTAERYKGQADADVCAVADFFVVDVCALDDEIFGVVDVDRVVFVLVGEEVAVFLVGLVASTAASICMMYFCFETASGPPGLLRGYQMAHWVLTRRSALVSVLEIREVPRLLGSRKVVTSSYDPWCAATCNSIACPAMAPERGGL